MKRRGFVAAVVCLALGLPASSLADRGPTKPELKSILRVFNAPGPRGRAFAARCVRIRVSTANPRYAFLGSPRRAPRYCVRTGQVGDGFVIFRRPNESSLRWKNIWEGSEHAPCKVPRAVRVDVLGKQFGRKCGI